jgi:PhoH-like ATPase
MLSTLHVEQRLPVSELADFTDVSQLLVNQCCELRVNGNGKAAWGIFKQHDGVGYLRRVNLKNGDRFGPCNPEQACARELMLDDQTLVVSLVGIAGTGKTLMALLSAFELYRAGRVSKIEVYRLNAEAGRQLGFLPGTVGDKMAPWAKPILDNLDYIIRRMNGSTRFTNQMAEHHGDKRDAAATATVEDMLARNVLEIAPINYLRGRSIHDAVVIVDDGQNLTQEDMKLVLTRAGEGTRVILTGEPDQIDRTEIDALSNGLVQVVERFKGEPTFAHLTMKDVVRSRIAEMAAKLL